MSLRSLCAVLGLSLFALPAAAVVKVYDSTAPHGTVSDEILFTTTLCPPVQSTPGRIQGTYSLSDTGGGTVTLTQFDQIRVVDTNIGPAALTVVFGPGSYVFVASEGTLSPALGTSHPGSTAPSGTLDWGVLSGWQRSGQAFCISSPTTICTGGAAVPHGVTVPVPLPRSPTYDLGTWAFDAEGDFQAASAYIEQTSNGGTTNIQFLLRGAFVGGSVPALPLVGASAIALGLLVAGARSALRNR